MEYISVLVSLLFILASLLSIYWGVHIIRLNPHSKLNWNFLLLTIALSIWSFGFAMSNATASIETAFFWRRFSSVGMVSIFGFILHFLLMLTQQNEDKKMNQFYYLLYLPALICMYAFTFSSRLASGQYDLLQTNYGLTNIASNTKWNYFYYSYYVLYMVLSMSVVWKWKMRIKEEVQIRQANIIIGTILFTAIFGTLTDVISSTFMENPLPQLAPLFILLPVWAMYYSARYYGTLNLETTPPVEMIATEKDRKKVFNNVSFSFYLGAILAFISEYIPNMNQEMAFEEAFIKSLTLASIGIAINIIQNIKQESLKEKLTITVLVISIPLATLQYIKYTSVTVWVFPIILMISSIIFSKLTLLISATVAAIATQLLIWAMYPEQMVVINRYDYMLRILLFTVAFLIGLYINRMYVGKIKENQSQLSFQKMVSDNLFEFVHVSEKNLDDKVNQMLENLGKFFDVDRTYLFTIDYKNHTMTYSNEWCNTGIKAEVGTIDEIPLTTFPWWIDQLELKGLVYIKDVDVMPEEAIEEQAQLHRQEVKSLVSVPVVGDGKILAFIGIDSVRKNRDWSEENIEMLEIMTKILYGGLMQIEASKEIKFMAYYDSLTNLPNRFLFTDRVQQAIYLSERTEKNIAIIFIDLDNFKLVNDTLGHKGGDDLLKQVAKILSNTVRRSDTVARFGGDEFMIIVDNITEYHQAITVMDKIMDHFKDPFIVEDQEFVVTASAGIALYPLDGEDTETLIKNADIAMYEAKSRGKNQYALYTKNKIY